MNPASPALPTWQLYVHMTRPGFLLVTAIGCFIGLAVAAAFGSGLDTPKATATVVLAVLAHAGANVLNDYFDSRNGADAANQQGMFPFSGGARFIQNGHVSERNTGLWGLALMGLVVAAGLLLARHSGGGLLLIGALGLLLGWAYSAPPLSLMSRGLGELAVAACWWLVVGGADYVQRGQFFTVSACVGVSYAVMVATILLVCGVPDIEADRAVGKRTQATRLSPRALAGLYLGLVVFAHVWLALLGVWAFVPSAHTRWACVALPIGLVAAWLLWHHSSERKRLKQAIVLTLVAAHVHGLGLVVGLLLPHL
jgi:1,4-dihydroxy-2-naphthoate octaprenyltransferase